MQVAVAADITEAEELRTILSEAGIAAEIEPAVEHHPREVDDVPQHILVSEHDLEAAQNAIEALSEPDEL